MKTTKPGLRLNWALGHHTLSGPSFNFDFKIIVLLHNNDFILLYNFLLYKKYTECILCHCTRLFFQQLWINDMEFLENKKKRVPLFLTGNFFITFLKCLITQLYQ